MDLQEFRIKHSELIEHYQFVESHLENLYAALNRQRPYSDGMQAVEKDTIIRLVNRIRDWQKEKNKSVLSDEDCNRLKRISERRNFWCHNCYVDLVFDEKTGGLKKKRDIEILSADMNEARQIRDYLFKKKLPYLEKVKYI